MKADQFIDRFRENLKKIYFGGNELKKLHRPLEYKDYLKILNLSWLEE
ncbi:hypothetical protein GWK41_03490 [Persephonella atlantica]|uniref:Uncharacterized protein n=1 Tax=Persephonella atlantica TaxID=2699429 RepID=A0ABS1GGZ4_9AQUI|nr:hypothetical protein [Persephonella atlantica]MBK3332130.1 hypothetical protein [Persephonella atlantica]